MGFVSDSMVPIQNPENKGPKKIFPVWLDQEEIDTITNLASTNRKLYSVMDKINAAKATQKIQ